MPQIYLANATSTVNGVTTNGSMIKASASANASSAVSQDDASFNAHKLATSIANETLVHDISLVNVAVLDSRKYFQTE